MTTIINFKTDSKIKTEAQKIAENMGLNLSDVLNVYLRNFVRHKELYISLAKDESKPTDALVSAVREAKIEYEKGGIKKFKGAASAIAHLKKL